MSEHFPLDADFRRLGVDAYAGYPLTGAQGKPLGLISVVSRRPLADPELVEAMLKIFAARAVTEVERRRADEALRASEEQYRAIFNASADALVLWDSRYRRVDVNPAYERLYGWSRDEVIGRGYEHPAFSPEYARPAPGTRTPGARRRDMPRRARRDPQATASAFRPRCTRYRSSIAASRTCSPSRATSPSASRPRRPCSASEAQYRAIFNASADAMMLWNSRLARVDVNPAHERIFGFTRDEVVGRGFEGLPYPEELRAAAHRDGAPRPGRRGQPRRTGGAAQGRAADRYRTARHSVRAPRRTSRAADRARHHRAPATEEALRASEAQYRAIFNASADALVLRDADFRIVDVNSTYEAWTGIARDQAIGSDRVLANPPGVNERVKALHSRVLNGEPIQLETQLLHRDGSFRELELRGMPIRHRGVPHVLYAGRDITERKRAEENARASKRSCARRRRWRRSAI